MVRRDAPASSPLADIEKHAAEFQKTFSEQFNSLVNSKNTQELNKALKEGSDSVLQQLSTLSNSLQGAVRTHSHSLSLACRCGWPLVHCLYSLDVT